MNVYCYYEPIKDIGDQERELLKLWKENWSDNGWTPIILGRTDAESVATFPCFFERVSALTSINPAGYDLACYLRWLAMAGRGGGLMTDYDCMSFGFTPERCSQEIGTGLLTLFERYVPCCVWGSEMNYRGACNLFSHYLPDGEDKVGGVPHISDMLILSRFIGSTFWDVKFLCKELGDPGWEDAPIVHFPVSKVGRLKSAKIREVIQQRKVVA